MMFISLWAMSGVGLRFHSWILSYRGEINFVDRSTLMEDPYSNSVYKLWVKMFCGLFVYLVLEICVGLVIVYN